MKSWFKKKNKAVLICSSVHVTYLLVPHAILEDYFLLYISLVIDKIKKFNFWNPSEKITPEYLKLLKVKRKQNNNMKLT